jgi:hypothetical protein
MKMKNVVYTDPERIDADITRWIETGNTTEVIAARMLKAQVPLLKEIIESRNLSYITGFVRGISNIIAAIIISLPPDMRQGVYDAIQRDLNRIIEVALKGPPKEYYRDE